MNFAHKYGYSTIRNSIVNVVIITETYTVPYIPAYKLTNYGVFYRPQISVVGLHVSLHLPSTDITPVHMS